MKIKKETEPVKIDDFIIYCIGTPGRTAADRGWYSKTIYRVIDIIDSDNGKPILMLKEIPKDEIDKQRAIHDMSVVHPRYVIREIDNPRSIWNRE